MQQYGYGIAHVLPVSIIIYYLVCQCCFSASIAIVALAPLRLNLKVFGLGVCPGPCSINPESQLECQS